MLARWPALQLRRQQIRTLRPPVRRVRAEVHLLRDATPARPACDPRPIDAALAQVDAGPPDGTAKPLYAGAVTLLGHDGKIVTRTATGDGRASMPTAHGTELPADQQIPMRTDTIFDMASVSKLFTSIVVMQLVEKDKVGLDTPGRDLRAGVRRQRQAGDHGPAGAHPHRGLPAWLPLWSSPAGRRPRESRGWTHREPNPPRQQVPLQRPEPDRARRAGHRVPARRWTSWSLTGSPGRCGCATPATTRTTKSRGSPRPSTRPRRRAAWSGPSTTRTPGRWTASRGTPGVFSTADDLAVLAQTFLNGGSYGGARILKESSVDRDDHQLEPGFPGNSHGLGFELDQRWYMDGLSGPATAGHTGYTGTSMVIDFDSRSFVILLTNRVHPSRNWGSNNPARRAVVQGLALRSAWGRGTARRLVLRYDGRHAPRPSTNRCGTGRGCGGSRSTFRRHRGHRPAVPGEFADGTHLDRGAVHRPGPVAR